MKFVDELQFRIEAGNGGDGVVRFLREKFKPKGGPSGGNGGRGGDVYVRAVRDSSLLAKYAHNQIFRAEHGGAGGNNSRHGADGEDLIIDLPLGSYITNSTSGEVFELLSDGQMEHVLKGGNGGLGNEHFKSSTNRTPKEFTKGKRGEFGEFTVELRIFADGGLIGFPNAGKSSLLNELTNAESKIGAYEFTTLSPHLGNMYGYILADIPGLIEGASSGKGLGHKFLRHIRRTKVLLHCISLENEDVLKAYRSIRGELADYDKEMVNKEEIVILTKTDVVESEFLENARKSLEALGVRVESVSVYDDESLKNLTDSLIKIFQN